MTSETLFRLWPYASVASFIGGIAARSILVSQEKLELDDAAVRESFPIRSSGGFCLLAVALAHLAGWIFPAQVAAWDGSPTRLYALEAISFGAGVGVLLWWSARLLRSVRGGDRSRLSEAAEVAFLSTVFAAVVSGLMMAVLYRWASSWSVSALTPYIRSLVEGRPAVGLPAELPWVVRFHLTAAFASLAMAPFTRGASVVALWLAGMGRLLLLPASAISEATRPLFAIAAKRLRPSVWLWPEED